MTCLVACWFGASAPAFGWSYEYRSQCCYRAVESGEVFAAWFDVRNTGPETWGSAVKLGTAEPQDRYSAFTLLDDWLSNGRPSNADRMPVLPGDDATFSFLSRAPAVTAPTLYREQFSILAELITWLAGPVMYLDWTVHPSQAPVATIVAAPDEVTRGQQLTVSARVSDNVGLAAGSVGFGGQTVKLTPPRPSEIAGVTQELDLTLNTAGATAGPQQLVVAARDRAGNTHEAVKSINVVVPASRAVPRFAVAAVLKRGRLREVRLTKARKGSRATVRCVKRCGKREVVGAKRQRRTGGLRLRLRRSLGRNSTFEIRVVAPGAVGRAQRYRVLGNQIKRVSSRCFERGHGTVAC